MVQEERQVEELYLRRVYSYMSLRKTAGLIGVLLPFVLVLGLSFINRETTIEQSISYYYHTAMGDVLVGAVCAVGLFMFFYAGYDKGDNWTGNVAGIGAVGLAWFPTALSKSEPGTQVIHLVFASIFFLSLAYFAIFRFTKTHDGEEPKGRKLVRNRIYIACGTVMVVCLVAILVYMVLDFGGDFPLVFVAETVALVAFGVSWLVKGEAFLADKTKGADTTVT